MMSFVIDRSTKYRPLLSLFLLCFVDVVAAESQFVTVNDPRPVAQAARELESKFGLPITYEDPPYVHASEIADVTAQVRRDQQNHRKVWVPRGGTLSLAYDLPSEQIEAPGTDASAALGVAAAAAIAALVRTDSASRGAQMFSVLESNGLFHVVPKQFIDASGRLQDAKPLLDTKISVPPKQRTGAELVGEICQSLSLATGQTVVVGTVPSKLLANPTTITAADETARSVLSRFLADLPEDLSWRLLYDPGLQWYALNIHVVPGTNK